MTSHAWLRPLVAWGAVVFSALYWVSDLIETANGGFSSAQLWLTLAAEAAVPLVLAGLYVLQRDVLGRWGLAALAVYGAVYVAFTATVIYALVQGTPDFDALSRALDPWMTLGGAVMVLAGIALGVAQVRAGAVAPWAGTLFGLGVVLVGLAAGAGDGLQLLAAGIRDAGFAAVCAMAALRRPEIARSRRAAAPRIAG